MGRLALPVFGLALVGLVAAPLKSDRPTRRLRDRLCPGKRTPSSRWPRTYHMYPEVHKVSQRLRAPEEVEVDEPKTEPKIKGKTKRQPYTQ